MKDFLFFPLLLVLQGSFTFAAYQRLGLVEARLPKKVQDVYPKKIYNKLKKLLITFLVFSISTGILYSQNKTIKGKVITEDLETLPYTLIFINNTVKVGRTDLNGFFQMDISGSVKKILFRSVGMEPATIELAVTCNEVEIVMIFSSTYDFKTPKKVDRLRMKKFKKLPALHKQAFEKGLFKTDKACYTQKFISYYKKK